MSLLNIVTVPDPILRKRAKRIMKDEVKNEELQRLIDDMVETMEEEKGIGLAAPQINRSIRLITVAHKDGTLAMINPRVTWKSLRKECDQEGCLSIPETFGMVKRPKKIRVRFWDRDGNIVKMKAEGLLARVMLHEMDHLDGILFIDKLAK